jgi:hypothetical protein
MPSAARTEVELGGSEWESNLTSFGLSITYRARMALSALHRNLTEQLVDSKWTQALGVSPGAREGVSVTTILNAPEWMSLSSLLEYVERRRAPCANSCAVLRTHCRTRSSAASLCSRALSERLARAAAAARATEKTREVREESARGSTGNTAAESAEPIECPQRRGFGEI